MLAAYFVGPRRIELREEPKPQLTRSTDVLVRIDRLGVCGSDVHYFLHGRIGDQQLAYPATLGHECSGTVEAVGEDVEDIKPGDRVAIDPAIVCGKCDQCRTGRPNTCRKLQFMGTPGEAPGAAAEWRVLPAENCFPVPENVSLDLAMLAEPLSIGYYAARMAEVYPACRVAILGAGPIGLSVLMFCHVFGPAVTYVTDLLDYRLEVAQKLGADWTGNPNKTDIVAEILQQEPFGVDIVFECSGDPSCIDQAAKILVPGGVIMLIGIPDQERVSLDIHTMRRAELTLRTVRRQAGCVQPVLDAIADGQIDPSPLITHRYRFEQINEAFELVAGYKNGVVKAVVDIHP